MNVVQLNTAHMNHEDALEVICSTRAVSDTIGIPLDTKGPEIRTCQIAQVYDRRVARQFSLSYGVYAEYLPVDLTVNSPLKLSVCRFVLEERFKDSDLVVILGGSFELCRVLLILK